MILDKICIKMTIGNCVGKRTKQGDPLGVHLHTSVTIHKMFEIKIGIIIKQYMFSCFIFGQCVVNQFSNNMVEHCCGGKWTQKTFYIWGPLTHFCQTTKDVNIEN